MRRRPRVQGQADSQDHGAVYTPRPFRLLDVKLKTHLALLSIATMAPLALFSWVALDDLRASEQTALHAQVFSATKSLASTVQGDVARAEAALRVLAASPSLSAGRYEDFRAQAMAARVAPENWIVVMDGEGRQLMNTRLSPGEPFPSQSGPPNLQQLLSTTDVTISGLVVGPVTRLPQIRLDMAVRRPDGQRLLLTSALSAGYFQRVLVDARLPGDWLVGVFDAQGITVARSHRAAEYVGKPGGRALLDAAARSPEGRLQTVSREGIALYDTFVRIPRLNWTVANGVRASELQAASAKALKVVTLGMVMAVIGSFLVALWLSTRLDRAFRQTAQAAAQIGRGELPALDRSHVQEFDLLQEQLTRVHASLLEERSARQVVEEQRQALLVSEQAARQLAEQQNRSKDEFLAMLGHELRNPLGAIRSASTIASSDRARPEARMFALGVIARQSDHLARIIEDLLEVNRVLRGKIVLQLERVSLVEVVETVMASMRTAGRLDRHEIAVALAPAFVLGDRTRLEQVVSNLLSNAVKFTPEGGSIDVRLSIDDDSAMLGVTDSGTGMTPELLESAFDLFVQGEPPIDRSQGGLGIGLALVRRLVQDHGGTCIASSAGLGLGSQFRVRLPLSTHGHPEAAQASAEASSDETPRRVLLVDDNADGRRALAEVLRMHRHAVDEAGNGQEALGMALEGGYDAAFVDIGLPGIDGLEVARRLRASPATASLRLFALTGYGEARDAALAAGFDRHIAKPVDPKLALAILGSLTPADAADPR